MTASLSPKRALHLYALAALVLLQLAGCRTAPTEAAADRDSVLVQVLADLHVAQHRTDGPAATSTATRDSILAAHGFTPASFDATIRRLSEEPGRLLAIYTDVLDTLNVRASRAASSARSGTSPP